jgi:hypothetical protein
MGRRPFPTLSYFTTLFSHKIKENKRLCDFVVYSKRWSAGNSQGGGQGGWRVHPGRNAEGGKGWEQERLSCLPRHNSSRLSSTF